MIEVVNKRILVDGRPHIMMAGEIHYYRVAREAWTDRIEHLKAAGCNTVASYIPWLLHERADGTFDLEGRAGNLCQFRGVEPGEPRPNVLR